MAKKTIRGYYQNTSSGESVFVKSSTGSKTMEIDSRGRSSSGYQIVSDQPQGVVFDSAGNPKTYTSNGSQILIGSKSDTSQAQAAAGISIKTSYSSSPVSVLSEKSLPLGVYDNVKLQTRQATPLESSIFGSQDQNMSISNQGSSRSAQSYLSDPNVKYVYFRGDQPVSVVSEVKPVSSGFTPNGLVSEYKGSDKVLGGLSSIKSAFVEGFTFSPSVDYSSSQASGVSSLAFTSGAVANLATFSVSEFLGEKAGIDLFKNTKYFNYAEKVFSVLKNPVVNSVLVTGFAFYGASKLDQAASAYRSEGSVGIARVAWMTNVEVSSLTAFSSGVSSGISSAQKNTHFFTQGSSNVGSLMAAESQTEGGFLSVSKSRGKVFEFYDGNLRRSLNYRDLSTAEGRYNVLSSKKYVKNGFDVSENVVSLRGRVDSKTNIFYSKPVSEESFLFAQSKQRLRFDVSTSYDYGNVMAIQTNREIFAGEIGGSKIGSGWSRFGLEEQRLSFRNSLGDSKISNQRLFSEGRSVYSYSSKTNDLGFDNTQLKGQFRSIEINEGKVSGRIKFKEAITQLKPVSNFENVYQGGSVNVQIQETLTKKLTDSLGGSLKSLQLRESQVSSVKPFGSVSKSRQVSESVFSIGKSDFRVESLSVSISSSALKLDQVEKVDVSVSSFRSPSLLTEQRSSSRSRNMGSQSLRQLSSFDLGLDQSEAQTFNFALRQNQAQRQRQDLNLRQLSSFDLGLDQSEAQTFNFALRQNQAQRQRQDLNLRQQQIYQSAQNTRFSMINFKSDIPVSKSPMFNLPKLPKGRESKGSSFLMGFSSFNPKYTSSVEANLLGIKGKKPSKYEIETGISLRPVLRF